MRNVFNTPFGELERAKSMDLENELKRISDRDLLANGVESFAVDIVARYRLEVPTLAAKLEIEPATPPRNSRVTLVHVIVRVSGDHTLFGYCGRSSIIISETVGVYPDRLTIAIPAQFDRPQEVRIRADQIVGQIKESLASLADDVKHYNDNLQEIVQSRLQARVCEIKAYEKFALDLKSAGFAITRRNDETEKIIIPVERRVLRLAPAKSEGKTPEPYLSMDHYDDILNALMSMMNVVERSPTVFESMEEEDLRTILLVGLNGVFKGQATGETFNGHGKNDILVRVEDRNIFIAECLMWNGPKYLRDKLDEQLFKYGTWRDSKLAVIVFNRNKDFTKVLSAMADVIDGHPQKVRTVATIDKLGGKYLFRRSDDTDQHYYVTALAFDIPRGA